MKTVRVRILSYRSPQRYAVRRTVLAAAAALRKVYPDAEIEIDEVGNVQDILQFTQILIQPCLMIEDRMVCPGRFPKVDEVVAWMKQSFSE